MALNSQAVTRKNKSRLIGILILILFVIGLAASAQTYKLKKVCMENACHELDGVTIEVCRADSVLLVSGLTQLIVPFTAMHKIGGKRIFRLTPILEDEVFSCLFESGDHELTLIRRFRKRPEVVLKYTIK
jgi:hypothetical protein